ncbi:hypothetical protein [Acinetobacter faecalis]|uniref:hypothetical protein n=1 Tax=Acinetobacter faecalis TaxID=2665161 RepID=UPI001D194E88|nr:hypothetical protein [Acinetobacter faecalis]
MKEIEKYIGYYLLVYLVVLAFCGFFQYMYECQGQSLSCAFSKDGFNTIITTTAYVLTPIVAIIGFTSWKKQKQYDLEKQYAEIILNNIDEIRSYLHMYYHQVNSYNNTESAKNALNNYKNVDFLQKQYLISSKFRTLQKLLNTPLSKNLLIRFENETLSFITAIDVAVKNELPFPKNKKIRIKVTDANQKNLIDRYLPLCELKLLFDSAYDDLTLELIKIVKPQH